VSVLMSSRRAARTFRRSVPFQALTGIGFGGYGVVHLAVAWLRTVVLTGQVGYTINGLAYSCFFQARYRRV
jgi:hypothetical protein